MNKATCIPTQQLACSDNGFVSSRSRMNIVLHAFSFLTVVLYFSKLFTDSKQELTCEVGTPPAKNESGNEIIKLCNGILYRLMIDSGEPPFPEKACDIKQVRSQEMLRLHWFYSIFLLEVGYNSTTPRYEARTHVNWPSYTEYLVIVDITISQPSLVSVCRSSNLPEKLPENPPPYIYITAFALNLQIGDILWQCHAFLVGKRQNCRDPCFSRLKIQ